LPLETPIRKAAIAAIEILRSGCSDISATPFAALTGRLLQNTNMILKNASGLDIAPVDRVG
jgi:hypothetical protein